MSAPITKGQMAFELPKLSYIDTSLEEPAVRTVARPARRSGIFGWLQGFNAWRAENRALAELNALSDRELSDVGLNRGDFSRLFDSRYNADLRARGRAI